MERKATARDVRMLTDVRDRLRKSLGHALPRPLTREQDRVLGGRPAPLVVDCNHGVPWTDCFKCSKARTP